MKFLESIGNLTEKRGFTQFEMLKKTYKILLLLQHLTLHFLFFFAEEKEYYETQFETLKSFEEVDALDASSENTDGEDDDEDKEQARHERAMKISNFANIVLLAFKVPFSLLLDNP